MKKKDFEHNVAGIYVQWRWWRPSEADNLGYEECVTIPLLEAGSNIKMKLYNGQINSKLTSGGHWAAPGALAQVHLSVLGSRHATFP